MLAKTPKELAKPRTYSSDKKRATLTFRVRGSLYEKLQKEAEASDRSLSETIEAGLEHYFDARDNYNELARLVGLAVAAVEAKAEKRYFADAQSRSATRAAIDAMLDIILAPRFDEDVSREIIAEQTNRLERRQKFGENLLVAPAPDIATLIAERERLTSTLDAKIAMYDALERDVLVPEVEKLAADDPRRAEAHFLRYGPEGEDQGSSE